MGHHSEWQRTVGSFAIRTGVVLTGWGGLMRLLEDGYSAVPAGKIATVVTCLEMTQKPALKTVVPPHVIARVFEPEVDWYRDLFGRVGREWMWFSRLRLSPEALLDIIRHPLVQIYAVHVDGVAEGLLELDFREARQCELAFFGLTAPLRGQGMGRALMNVAMEEAFAKPIERFWVHTCTLDDPRAVSFYRRSGFNAYERRVEVADDPRLRGEAPIDVQPDVPLIRPAP
jgi:GNAT superfamily N-acetyltransferase